MFAAASPGKNATACHCLAYHRFALVASAQVAEPVVSLGKRDDRVSGVRAVGFAQGPLRKLALSPESLGASGANRFEPCACVGADAVKRAAGIACFPQGPALRVG